MASHLRFALAASAVAALLAACGAFSGSSGSPSPQADAAADALSSGGDAEGADAESSSTCPVIYVDGNGTAGADTNDGCGTNRPTHSISYAITRATSAGAKEIHVCEGTFDEAPITLPAPISLLGSYQCGSFTPPSDLDGGAGPTFTPTTTLDNPGSTEPTLIVTGAAITSSTRIDGFTINGASVGAASAASVAMQVTMNAAPTLSNLALAGGGGTGSSGAGSTGLLIDTGAAPILTRATVMGGSGSSGSGGVGSVGIYASNAGPFSIASSVIDGGTGKSATNGSVAIYVSQSSATNAPTGTIVIDSSEISGGQGSGTTIASAGVLTFADPRLKVTRNRITAGAGQCLNTTTSCTVAGVYSGSATAIEVFRNAIYAGSGTTALANITGYGVIFINPPSASSALIHENMIDADGTTMPVGVRIVSVSGVQLLGNTIVAGPTTTSHGVELVGVTNATLDNNLFAVSIAIRLVSTAAVLSCTTGLVIDNNALLTTTGAHTLELGDCSESDGGVSNDGTLNLLTAVLPSASGNVRLSTAAECTGDPACTNPSACASDSACYGVLFSAQTLTETTLLSSGIALAAGAPCIVTHGGLGLTSEPTDYYGTARAAPFSIGAEQFTGACTSN